MSIAITIKKQLSRAFSLDVALEARDNRCLGILGASGCGKSMTLKCIAGIETPDEGEITLDRRVLFSSRRRVNVRTQARRVGYLFQNYALFPTMTTLENIASPLALPKKERLARARYWLLKFGLAGLEDRLPKKLSGGQQQRAALARMLVAAPAAVLLDEPFSALDSNLREYMQLEIEELIAAAAGGGAPAFRNAIFVSHSREEVFKLCPDLVIMDAGRVIAAGETPAVFERPPNVRSARLTGCKNISAVEKRGTRRVFARDWGVELATRDEVDDAVTHVGIRAHSLTPAGREEAAGQNEVRLAGAKYSRGLFEDIVTFHNADAQSDAGRHEIWWKLDHDDVAAPPAPLPPALHLPAESLILLRGE
jgi:molybdate transport system ATP-binding protein